MPQVEVRPFRRSDREQVTRLVNAHAAAVVPGVVASVNTVLSQLEREPGEFVVDPWVLERRALVGEQGGSVAAAALLLRYRDDPDVGPAFRGVAEIRWLLFWPMAPAGNPFWQDGESAAQIVMAACLEQCARWGVGKVYADGALPLPGVYGVPVQWPHIERLYREHGFEAPSGAVEVLHLAQVDAMAEPGPPALPGLQVHRLVGINGTRFTVSNEHASLGYIEVEILDLPERHHRSGGLADIGNLFVTPSHRRRGVGTHLLRSAAAWLRLGRVDRLLHYAAADRTAGIAFAESNGFREITRTRRGWPRSP